MKPHEKICASPFLAIACFVLGVCVGIIWSQDAAIEQLNTDNVRVVSK